MKKKLICPACGSHDITTREQNVDDSQFSFMAECNDCDHYDLLMNFEKKIK